MHSESTINGFYYNVLTIIMMINAKVISVPYKAPETHPIDKLMADNKTHFTSCPPTTLNFLKVSHPWTTV